MADTSAREFVQAGALPTQPVKVPEKGITDTVLLSEQEAQLAARILSNPSYFPESFKSWIVQYLSLNGEQIPRSQIQGLSQQTARYSAVDTNESRSSSSFGDLSTVGPELTELSDGNWIFLFGAEFRAISDGTDYSADMGLSINSAAVDTADSNHQGMDGILGVEMMSSRAVYKTIANNNNSTVTCKYKSNGTDTFEWRYRWLIGIKVGN